jgi:hypothetical protein
MNINTLKLRNLTSFNKNCVADTNILIYNKKQIINFINIYNYIKQALKLKNVYIENISFYLVEKNLIVKLFIYYSSLKLVILKKKSKISGLNKQRLNLYSKNSLFPQKFIKYNKLNNATLTFVNINKEVNTKKALELYKTIKKSILVLLKKKRYLLIDFIRATALLIEAKISVKIFTIFIGQIFASLTKKSHNRFFLILKKFFKVIITDNAISKDILKIEGIKLTIGGRLRGKTRADVRSINVGTVPLQSNSKHIEYFKQHIFTIYGTFGLKLWVFRNKQIIKNNI